MFGENYANKLHVVRFEYKSLRLRKIDPKLVSVLGIQQKTDDRCEAGRIAHIQLDTIAPVLREPGVEDPRMNCVKPQHVSA